MDDSWCGMDKSLFLMGLSFPICTMTQLIQKPKIPFSSKSPGISSALCTAQFSRDLGSRGLVPKVGTCVDPEKTERLMISVKGQEGDALTLCHGHELCLFLIWDLRCIWSYSCPSTHIPLNLMTCPLCWKIHLSIPMPIKRGARVRESSPFSTTFSKMFMKFFWAMPLRDVSCDFAISSNSCG